jgi:hypothetical protein
MSAQRSREVSNQLCEQTGSTSPAGEEQGKGPRVACCLPQQWQGGPGAGVESRWVKHWRWSPREKGLTGLHGNLGFSSSWKPYRVLPDNPRLLSWLQGRLCCWVSRPKLGWNSALCHSVIWGSSFTSLNLSFFTCQVGIITIVTTWRVTLSGWSATEILLDLLEVLKKAEPASLCGS